MDIESRQLEISSDNESPDKLLEKKADDLDRLLNLIKEKMIISNRPEKIKLLTLVPISWKQNEILDFFPVTKYMITESKKLLQEKGILASPEPKKGRSLPKDIVELVENFYCDDEYSRQMPGKKDYVSISRNVHMQKRLILCNLSELFACFKEKYPRVKIHSSKFYSLRPKWCLTVGASGAHTVCVCTIHQNVKLMVDAIDSRASYKDYIDLIVCDINSKECMIHRCNNCPGTTPLKIYLETLLKEERNKEEMSFKQWTTTDRAELINRIELVDDFIELLIKKIDHLTTHSYISKAQAKYLNNLKENLSPDEVIVLGDFAENYQFVIQDEIQGYHWNSSQCTLHPIMIYYKDIHEHKLLSHSLCFISDDLNHDVDMVYEVISNTIGFIKSFLPLPVKQIHYFSDGCAGQYKNCKNLLNQCLHYEDFSIKSTWSFFATSHGKSPCDGLGGTIKRLTARASLQRTSTDQITTTEDMVKFCQEEIAGITTIFIPTEIVKQRREIMKDRYKIARTIPGTRSFHFFLPIDKFTIRPSLKDCLFRVTRPLKKDHGRSVGKLFFMAKILNRKNIYFPYISVGLYF